MAWRRPTDAPPARLKTRYLEEIRPALIERFGYSSVMQAPKLEKITLNMGVGLAKQDSKVLKAATEQLATIAGQQPSVRRARKSIAAFKLREGMPVGVAVTLRGERGYEFLDRLDLDRDPAHPRLPRPEPALVRRPRQLLDGRQGADHLPGDRLRRDRPGARPGHHDHDDAPQSDVEAFALLAALGMPFSPAGPPEGLRPGGRRGRAPRRTPSRGGQGGRSGSRAGAEASRRQPSRAAEAEAAPPSRGAPSAEAAAEPEAEPEAEAEPRGRRGAAAEPRQRRGRGRPQAEPRRQPRPSSAEPRQPRAEAARAEASAEQDGSADEQTADEQTTEKESSD